MSRICTDARSTDATLGMLEIRLIETQPNGRGAILPLIMLLLQTAFWNIAVKCKVDFLMDTCLS